ncbi:hypothetical protein QJS04_geneDACA012163 [Acorus gramineus]|uniref:Uncharacterized protein n=1 Tax=Acorus gramineus TaxID=55184 RepID=A0AAV9B8I5_ACOGR|nr:hypothetical protein QJS04_geneDACA012163 [Acorus gramineus]
MVIHWPGQIKPNIIIKCGPEPKASTPRLVTVGCYAAPNELTRLVPTSVNNLCSNTRTFIPRDTVTPLFYCSLH